MTATATGKHPAPYTDSIIDALADIIPSNVPPGHWIHDPFAGDGTRLRALCDRLGYTFTGTDIEAWPGSDDRVLLGDSTSPKTYPWYPHAIVTSPTYNNGVNDHFEPRDTSKRLTYRTRLGRSLHPNNTGRWSGRSSKKGEAQYWHITNRVVKHWPDIAIVNVKNSTRAGRIYPLVQLWSDLLGIYGYSVTAKVVECPGWRYGANGDKRVDTESILIGHRP